MPTTPENDVTPSLIALTLWIEALISAYLPTIKTLKVGYISEVATGQTDYDVLLLLPPKATIPEPRNWNRKDYSIHYFLIRQDVGASGDVMTSQERITAWGMLESLNKQFVQCLMTDNANYQVVDQVTVDPNSGGGDQLLPDAVIWLEVTLTLRVNDC